MTSQGWPIIEELQQRTAEYQRYSMMTPSDLPADLKAEAEELAIELADDLDALGQFWADLHRREHLLTADDRRAAHYTLQLAIESWPIVDHRGNHSSGRDSMRRHTSGITELSITKPRTRQIIATAQWPGSHLAQVIVLSQRVVKLGIMRGRSCP